ncbi:MAG TPA: GNAT family N-acetyltransferase [Chloroflexota bacterium]|nr:GNAT family N-acetyltransferase [Chloroflexota bacterium]
MIAYSESAEGITAGMLQGFFAGWPSPPSPETHLRVLRGSQAVVIALDGARVVGFVSAIGDGVLSASISLLEVRAEYRRQGIGSELIRRVLVQLEGLNVDLSCDPELVPFYARFGMQPVGVMNLRPLLPAHVRARAR